MKKLNGLKKQSLKEKSLKNEMQKKVLGGLTGFTCENSLYDKETLESCDTHVQCDNTHWRH